MSNIHASALPKTVLTCIKEELTHEEYINFIKDRIVLISAASMRKVIDAAVSSCFENKALTKPMRIKNFEVINVTEENTAAVLLALKILDRLLS